MKARIVAVLSLSLIFTLSVLPYFSPSYACGGFAGFPLQGKEYMTEDDTNVMIVYNNHTETLIIEPSYKGNASEFGLVVPIPARPTLTNVPKELFSQLENLTSPIPPSIPGTLGMTRNIISAAKSPGVQIIERKDVGDFKATILTADSTDSLIQWLKDNSFQYHPQDEKNFEYYIQKGGYYFVALKVNIDTVSTDGSGILQEKLNPLGFTFNTEAPTLSLRIEAGTMPVMKFNLYVLSSTPYYVPGADMLFSRAVTQDDLMKAPALLKYDGVNQWLIRQTVSFDPTLIQEDLTLVRGNEQLQIHDLSIIKVNSELVPIKSGVLIGEEGSLRSIDVSPSAEHSPTPILLELRLIVFSIFIFLLLFIVGIIRYTNYQTKSNSWNLTKKIIISFLSALASSIGLFLTAFVLPATERPVSSRQFIFGIVSIILLGVIVFIANTYAVKRIGNKLIIFVLLFEALMGVGASFIFINLVPYGSTIIYITEIIIP